MRFRLAAHGITLPSLGVDLPSFAARCPSRSLIALGNCNPLTARALLDALSVRWGVDRWPGGKTVWCELAAQPSGAGRDAHRFQRVPVSE
ncbi:hypothetical protein ACWCRF_15605 [Streptomyces sp. NPDC002405]|uniref:hypothetical protein n=1 Tax=unclassified Streptomyces TaxID=2593676 RepID=UPI003673C7AC